MLVADSVVLITGAGGGIGRALALGFARDGAALALCDRDASALTETANLCAARELHTRTVDVSDDLAAGRFVQETLSRFGRIDVLLNNAGVVDRGPLLSTPFSDWARVIAVNLVGVASFTYHVLPSMLANGHGRIINLASREAEYPRPDRSAYVASKAGVISFTRAVALSIDRDRYPDVLVNALVPGPTRTGMNQRDGLQEPEAVYPHARYVAELPSGGPTGRTFWNSRDYPMYTHFNEERPAGGGRREG
jgi:NAD(P)-dependent dehydrogenase (short-subunit alcohol dehydrogenase family)